jgi:hypothetical protein
LGADRRLSDVTRAQRGESEPQTSDKSTAAGPSSHEVNYNVIAAAIATAAATMLTLLTTLGTTDKVMASVMLRGLLEAELLVLELALILSIVSLLRRGEEIKRQLVRFSSALVVSGTLLLWFSATLILFSG